jgi:hypothetical protein
MSTSIIGEREFIRTERQLLIRPTVKTSRTRFFQCLLGAALAYVLGQWFASGSGDWYINGRLATGTEREQLERVAKLVCTGLAFALLARGVYLITGGRKPFLLTQDGRLQRGKRVLLAAGTVSHVLIHKQEAEGGRFSVCLVGKEGQVSPTLFADKSEEATSLAALEITATVDLPVRKLGALDCEEEEDRLIIKDMTPKNSYRLNFFAILFGITLAVSQLWPLLSWLRATSNESFFAGFNVILVVVGLLMIAACFAQFRGLIANVLRWKQGGPTYILERSSNLLTCNGKPLGRLSDIQQVQVERVTNTDEGGDKHHSYFLVLQLPEKKRISVGGRHSKVEDAEEVAKKIAAFANVEFHHTQKRPVSISFGAE